MRALCLLFLLAFIALLGMFAYQNQGQFTLFFWDRSITTEIPLAMGAIYLLGMFSGWAVVGMLRNSVSRIVQVPVRNSGF